MTAKLIHFPVKPRTLIVVQRSCLTAPPISDEVAKALGLGPGLVLYGGNGVAKQLGSAEVRPLKRLAD